METLETYPIDPTATDEETSAILRRRAEQIIHEASIPTLHKVITTAAELKKYHEGLWYTASTLGPSEIENFLQLSRAPIERLKRSAGWATTCNSTWMIGS